MTLDSLITAAVTGAVIGVGKLVGLAIRRSKNSSQSRQQRQLDRLEGKVDCLGESALETQHRLARIETDLGIESSNVIRMRLDRGIGQ